MPGARSTGPWGAFWGGRTGGREGGTEGHFYGRLSEPVRQSAVTAINEKRSRKGEGFYGSAFGGVCKVLPRVAERGISASEGSLLTHSV